MSGLFARFRRSRDGSIAVELALLVPILFGLLMVSVELGRALYQANALEKGVRAGALFAARGALPFTVEIQDTIENLVRTGDPTGAAAVLASGWSLPGASIEIDASASFDTGAGIVPLIRIEATVPFDPLMPRVMTYLGLGNYSFSSRHLQPYVGN